MPNPATIPAGITDLLIQIGSRGQLLVQDRQSLKRLDWINRLGSEEWNKIAKMLTQDDCEHLIRGLVIAERDLEWNYGSLNSVSGAIWVFHVYELRFAPSHIQVADWVLQNRGTNNYLPFGVYSDAQNYDEYLDEQRAAVARYQGHVVREGEQQEAKKRREEKRIKDHMSRLEKGKERAARVKKFNAELALIPTSERLGAIVTSGMPLEAISKEILVRIPDTATQIDAEIKLNLIKLIDRRNRGIWGRIKKALI